jgi:hypothetical protein
MLIRTLQAAQAYLGSFEPANLYANYLGDGAST